MNKTTTKDAKFLTRHDQIANEILSDPDLPQTIKDDFIEFLKKLYKKHEEQQKEYEKYIEQNKGKKIVRYDSETFLPIFED